MQPNMGQGQSDEENVRYTTQKLCKKYTKISIIRLLIYL